MMSFNRILFPVDLSRQSHEAAPFVAAIAERFRSDVIVLHVLRPAAAGELESKRHEFCGFVREYFQHLPVQPRIVEGDPAESIVTFAREKNINLTMLPTHGSGPFRRLLIGSVAAKVLHDLASPVWTGVHTANTWSHSAGPWKRFLCAIDGDACANPVLQWAAHFAHEQKAELRIVHAINTPAGMWEDRAGLRQDAGINGEVTAECGPVSQVVRDTAVNYQAD